MFLLKLKNCIPKNMFNLNCEKKCKVVIKIKGKIDNCKFKSKIYFTLYKKSIKHYSLKNICIKKLKIYNNNSSSTEDNCLLYESTSCELSEKEDLLYSLLNCMIKSLKINYNKENKKYEIFITKPSKINKMIIKGKYVCL